MLAPAVFNMPGGGAGDPQYLLEERPVGPVFSRRPLAFRALHEQATVGRNKTTSTFGRAFSGGPRKQEGARASPPPIGQRDFHCRLSWRLAAGSSICCAACK